ncbi:hypothetical protein RCL1_001683 [Eukaryota sp. TZLM3-RCL]
MRDFTWFTDVYNKPCDFVFLIPINDFYVLPTEARGAHWSLLVFERFKDIRNFYYIDSFYNTDCLEAAQIIVSKLNLKQTNLTFHELECIQQPNGFNCGVYTCRYAVLVLQVYHCHHNVPILEIESACRNGPPDISTFREDLEKLDISMIQSKHLASQHERLLKFIRYVQRQGKSPRVLEYFRETDVGHLNGRKTKDKETVFGPKVELPTPKVNSSFVAERKPKGTPKKGKQSKKPKKDLIAFASEDEFDFNDSSTVMSIDIETRRKTDLPVTN